MRWSGHEDATRKPAAIILCECDAENETSAPGALIGVSDLGRHSALKRGVIERGEASESEPWMAEKTTTRRRDGLRLHLHHSVSVLHPSAAPS
jgi:hypothetical protein